MATLEAGAAVHLQQIDGVALEWLEHDHQPRILVRFDLTLLWTNEGGRAFIGEGRVLEIRNATLATIDRSQQERLREFVSGSTQALSTLCLKCHDDEERLLLRAHRMLAGGLGAVGLVLIAADQYRPLYHDLDQAFSLTPAEHRVLLALLQGNGAEALARHGEVSLETIRSQIRSIYHKLGVGTREHLFLRTQPFRL